MTIYHNYLKWDCWRNGLYSKNAISEEKVILSKYLLSNSSLFREAALLVVNEWKFSSEHFLSNPIYNRRAWLGQASCCYNHGATEFETKVAWNSMPLNLQRQANAIAQQIIDQLNHKNNQLCLSLI